MDWNSNTETMSGGQYSFSALFPAHVLCPTSPCCTILWARSSWFSISKWLHQTPHWVRLLDLTLQIIYWGAPFWRNKIDCNCDVTPLGLLQRVVPSQATINLTVLLLWTWPKDVDGACRLLLKFSFTNQHEACAWKRLGFEKDVWPRVRSQSVSLRNLTQRRLSTSIYATCVFQMHNANHYPPWTSFPWRAGHASPCNGDARQEILGGPRILNSRHHVYLSFFLFLSFEIYPFPCLSVCISSCLSVYAVWTVECNV